MTEINDEFLLKQLLDFCDNIKDEEGLAEFSKADNFFHPLDREVKHQIDVLMKKGTTKRERDKMTIELSYEMNGEIDKLWNMLIRSEESHLWKIKNCHMYMEWIL